MLIFGRYPKCSVPNFLTSCCAASGFLAIACAYSGRLSVAASLILASLILDRLDGTVARLMHTVSTFGGRLDAHADALSFCAAPAAFLLAMPAGPTREKSLVAIVYLLCGLWRLSSQDAQESSADSSALIGLPTAASACLILSLAALLPLIPAGLQQSLLLMVPLACGALMLSRFIYPKNGLVTGLLQITTPISVISIWMNWR